jgi:hypothetical protein
MRGASRVSFKGKLSGFCLERLEKGTKLLSMKMTGLWNMRHVVSYLFIYSLFNDAF